MTPDASARIRFSADDFGLSEEVNEAVEIAHRRGVLDAASLMVGAPAAADAVRRARAMPALRVGLHLVVIEGQAVLPAGQIPDLVDADGLFGSDQFGRAVRYFVRPGVRRQLAAEIAAQFAAFAATGLALDHANAHKHMHLHPTVGRLLIDIGRRHGLRRIRVPAEPPQVMAACGVRPTLGSRCLYRWTEVLRSQARRAGMASDESVFGLAWSGGMTKPRLLRLGKYLPSGTVELYFHPATANVGRLAELMPQYDHAGELTTLCDPDVARAYGRKLD